MDKLYERMSSAFQPDAEPRKNADQVFEELNQDLNMSELRKDIDRLKDRIATDHSGFLWETPKHYVSVQISLIQYLFIIILNSQF